VLNTVAAAVDSVIEIATIDSVETYKVRHMAHCHASLPVHKMAPLHIARFQVSVIDDMFN